MELWRQAADVFAYCQCCGIAHCDIKPSNILMVRDDSKKGGLSLRVSDFGTSISINDSQNEQLSAREITFPNHLKFMTPLYASPNIIQKVPRINYYLEDVFSLGMTFLQLAGPFTSDELSEFSLNKGQPD